MDPQTPQPNIQISTQAKPEKIFLYAELAVLIFSKLGAVLIIYGMLKYAKVHDFKTGTDAIGSLIAAVSIIAVYLYLSDFIIRLMAVKKLSSRSKIMFFAIYYIVTFFSMQVVAFVFMPITYHVGEVPEVSYQSLTVYIVVNSAISYFLSVQLFKYINQPPAVDSSPTNSQPIQQ